MANVTSYLQIICTDNQTNWKKTTFPDQSDVHNNKAGFQPKMSDRTISNDTEHCHTWEQFHTL